MASGELQRKQGRTANARKLETGLRPNRAGIPYTLLLRIEAIGFPTFGLLLYQGEKEKLSQVLWWAMSLVHLKDRWRRRIYRHAKGCLTAGST